METKVTIKLDIPGEFTNMVELVNLINQKYLGAALAYWRDVEQSINEAGGLSAEERKRMLDQTWAWEKTCQIVKVVEVSCEHGAFSAPEGNLAALEAAD